MRTFIALIVASLLLQINTFCQSSWEIEASNIDPNNYYGITLANGMIGMVSSPDPLKVKDVILNGVYDYYQRGRVSNILKVFNHANVDIFIDQHLIGRDQITGFQQTLNMKEASLETEFQVPGKATIKSNLMALRHLPYSALNIIEITAESDILFSPSSVIESPNHLNDVRNLYSVIERPHVYMPLMSSVALSPSGKIKVSATNSFIFNEDHHDQPMITHIDWDYNRHWIKFEKELKAGETYKFAIVSTVCSSKQYEDPHNESERLTIYAVLEGTENLIKRHNNHWADLWESDIIVEGSEDITRDIRSALYHLYSFSREGTAYSLSPMGLSGLGYNGHVFWDTEIWMYPPLLLLKPEIARSLLEYRWERLAAAKENAFAHGYKGAMFPWESSDDGSEDTPVWALTGPFQHHISGDIGWAYWKYYQVTKDHDFLRERAYPMLKEVADFWVSRVERNGPGQYDINNVIGANEWEENIDNNAYTNGMAITVLNYAIQAAEKLGFRPNPDWKHVADNIPILKFPDGTTRENATYSGVDIKQADVNLLAYPMKIIHKKEDIKKDLNYYEPRMSPEGPAMGFAILSILHNRLGNSKKAAKIFANSYKPNELPPFAVIAETANGTNPYFATGAGGMLQAVLAGFGGLDITDEGIIQLDTKIPPEWERLVIKGVGTENKTFVIEN